MKYFWKKNDLFVFLFIILLIKVDFLFCKSVWWKKLKICKVGKVDLKDKG